MSDKHLTNIELYNLCLEIHKQRLKKIFKDRVSKFILKTSWFFNEDGFIRWFKMYSDSQKWTRKDIYIIYQAFRAVYSSTWQAQILVFFNRLNFNNKNDN